TTRPSGAARKAASCSPDNRRAVALPAHLTAPSPGGQAPLALELGERVGAVLGVRTVLLFFSLRRSLLGLLVGTLGPQHAEEGLRQHAERDVPIPALPGTHLILVESDLAFPHLEALLYRPACADHLDHRLQGGSLAGKHQHVGQLGRLGTHRDAAPDHQPALPTGGHRAGEGQAHPVVEPWPFTARSCTSALPGLWSHLLGQLIHSLLVSGHL